MRKIKVSLEVKILIQEACEEYKKEFRKHRKDVTHFSKDGLYQEWEKNKFKEREID